MPIGRRRRTRRAAAGGAVPAPVIDTDAVIGAELDAGAGYAAYQWQSSADGAMWADIDSATSQTYTPDDAVFGLFLRVKGDGAASNATGRVAEVPAQTLGAELLTNGSMEAGSPPAGYVAAGSTTLSAEAEERTGGSGAQCLDVASAVDGNFPYGYQDVTVDSGEYYAIGGWARNVNATGVRFETSNPAVQFPSPNYAGTTWVEVKRIIRFTSTSTRIRCLASADAGESGRFDDLSLKKINRNAQLTAPSSDMIITQMYTLPVSPVDGDTVRLMARIDSAGNWWKAEILYTGTQWNITLYKTTAFSDAASAAAAANIGTTNGIRITANGDNLTLETTANGGIDWTQRGVTIEDSTYQNATGVNVWCSPGVTLGEMRFAVPL